MRENYPGEPMSEAKYHAVVEAIASKCECGGQYKMDAPPRCPKCKSADLRIDDHAKICYDWRPNLGGAVEGWRAGGVKALLRLFNAQKGVKMSALEEKISEIGRQMVVCPHGCDGIRMNRPEGYLPGALILETGGRGMGRGCMIVGINPGHATDLAREYYLEHGLTYEACVDYWWEKWRKRPWPYYRRLKNLADALGLHGPIVWTELVKCESFAKGQRPPLQTFRTCANVYLRKEINSVPRGWALIAAGREVFTALGMMFPNRVVLGVPHPTGNYPLFDRLFDKHDGLRQGFRVAFGDLRDGGSRPARWFDAGLGHLV